MAGAYDFIDCRFSWNGDLVLSDHGDIADTSIDTIQSLKDQVNIICSSVLDDWELYPGRGAGLDDFVGEPNNEATGNAIKSRLSLALTSANIVNENDLYIRVIPVHIHRVMIVIKIDAVASRTNSLGTNGVITSLLFDTVDHSIFFLDKNPQIIGGS
jgi:hypothetical protein